MLDEEAGRRDEAVAAYQSLSRRPAREREALHAIVRLGEAPGADPASLAGALDRLLDLEQGPTRANLAERLVALRKQEGDAGATERALMLGFSADPTRAGLRDELPSCVRGPRRLGPCRGHATTGNRGMSRRSALRFGLADARQKAGDIDAALRALDVAPASRTDKAEVAVRRSQVLEAAGRHEAAMTELDAAYHLDSRHGPALLAALERTNLGQSQERWLVTTADILSKQGVLTKARKLLQGWFDQHPESLPVLRRLARLASRGGTSPPQSIATSDFCPSKAARRESPPPSISPGSAFARAGRPKVSRPSRTHSPRRPRASSFTPSYASSTGRPVTDAKKPGCFSVRPIS